VKPLPPRPLLLGHRGARAVKSIPENTFSSFDRALADGAGGFEFDVRLSADGVAVVCHDPVHRDAQAGKLEIAQTPSERLNLPRLEEVLVRYQENAFLDIELKVPGIEKASADLLRRHPPARGFVVSSFLPEVLRTLHAEDASIPLGLICETKAQLQDWCKLPVSFVIPHRRLVNQELLGELKAAGKKVMIWTVNSLKEMRRLAGYEGDGFISDDVAKLAQILPAIRVRQK
jgi:glycerophosphoryl diester phosphodiesterase